MLHGLPPQRRSVPTGGRAGAGRQSIACVYIISGTAGLVNGSAHLRMRPGAALLGRYFLFFLCVLPNANEQQYSSETKCSKKGVIFSVNRITTFHPSDARKTGGGRCPPPVKTVWPVYRCTLPEPSPPASLLTSSTETKLQSPSMVCFRQLAATANSIASCGPKPVRQP